jgi:hypothetical protein
MWTEAVLKEEGEITISSLECKKPHVIDLSFLLKHVCFRLDRGGLAWRLELVPVLKVGC